MICIFSKRDKVKLCFDHKTRGRNRPLVIHATLIKLNDDRGARGASKQGAAGGPVLKWVIRGVFAKL